MTQVDHKAEDENRMDGIPSRPVPKQGPWQILLADCDLTLHVPLGPAVDGAALQREFAEVDRWEETEKRTFYNQDGSWSGISLINRNSTIGNPGIDQPTLALMPTLTRYIASSGWFVLACSLMRLPPGGVLPWHYEHQGPLFKESRLILPIHAPSGAVTLIGGAAVAYPVGQTWIGDFSFPHQVENRSDTQRIVVAIDVQNTPSFLDSLPSELSDQRKRRIALAQEATNSLLSWWTLNPPQQRAYQPPDKALPL